MNKKILLSVAILAIVGVSNANADLITFDEFNPEGEILYGEYFGFSWSGFVAIGSIGYSELIGTGYDFGAVTKPNVAFNGAGYPASFYTDKYHPFELDSMYVTKAGHDGWTHFDGYADDVLIYSLDVFATTRTPVLVNFNWTNLSKVVMSDGDHTWQTAIDNISFTMLPEIPVPDPTPVPVPVPEPETYAMLLAGIGLLGFMARRRKESAM